MSPLRLHVLPLILLHGCYPLTSLTLPRRGKLDVGVQCLLQSRDLDGELSHLLRELSIACRG